MNDTENYLKPISRSFSFLYNYYNIVTLLNTTTNLSIEECVIETRTTQYFN